MMKHLEAEKAEVEAEKAGVDRQVQAEKAGVDRQVQVRPGG